MGRASLVITAALVALLLAGAVGVYAYDSSRDDMVAEGVTIGGVDVGGMRAEEARAALKKEIKRPLQRSLRVRAGDQRFTLTAEEARVRTDLDSMVEDALAESRDGNLLTRAVRDLSGGSVDADLPPRVTYSRAAVRKLVAGIEASVNRPAQDAEVEASGSGLTKVPAEDGVRVQARKLTRAIVARLESPDGGRQVRAGTEVVKPQVTEDELAGQYPHYITIDRGSKQLRYYRNLKLAETYAIAVGRVGFETPSGLYSIQTKAVDPAWHVPEWGGRLAGQVIPGGAPDNPLKERWLGIYDGAGIHGTDDVGSLGTAASHGCIRMSIPEVLELYDKVPLDTPVYIQ